MESKKINQLATEMTPTGSDLTIIGDPITGVSRKITLLQLSATIGTGADLQGVTDNGATTTNPIAIGGLTITGLATGVLKSDSGVISSVPFGAANGVATLGGDGKVPSIQLPSYVDDVVEVANFAALPVTGETGKIYITLDNNKVYRWTGSIYVEIAANNAVWGAITGTLSNQTDLQTALNLKANDNAVVHLAGTETISGVKTFTTSNLFTGANLFTNFSQRFNQGVAILETANFGATVDYTTIVGAVNGLALRLSSDGKKIFAFADATTNNTFTFPNATGTIALTSDIPSLTGYVPYTGATANVNLGTFDLTADVITGATGSFTSSGGSDSFAINHSSGSGIALNITKGGNGEGLYINKTSGSGNAATIIGTLNATTLVKSGGTSSQFLKADGSVDSTSYGTGSVTSVGLSSATSGVTIGSTPITTSGTITLAIATASGSQNGLLSSTDWTTFNGKQAALNGTGFVKISGTTISYDNSTYLTTSAAASTYLPLSGGTLTGALNGTSAVFSGSVTATTFEATDVESGVSANYYSPYSGGSSSILSFLYGSSGSVTWNNGGVKMTLTSAGALQVTSSLSATSATFSGNMAIGGTTITDANMLNVIGNQSSVNIGVVLNNTNSTHARIYALQNVNGNFNIRDYTASSDRLSISSTGAATFSSSVGINGGSTNFPLVVKVATNQNLRVSTETFTSVQAINDAVSAFVTLKVDGLPLLLNSQSGGKVGIGGVTNPSYAVSVGSANGDAIGIQNGSANTSNLYFSQYSNEALSYTYIRADARSTGYMAFHTNDTERMRITSGGDVGIGMSGVDISRLTTRGKDSTSTNYAFIAQNSATTNLFLVRNDGAVSIYGALSKGSGSFKIDHPLESMTETHNLVHSFVESPQANNIYRGKVELVNGKAKVNLDEVSTMTEGTFVALNREIHTYTSNETDWDAVRGNVKGNILIIECQNNQSNAIVSWLVIGERQDKHMMETAWTDDNGRVIVEPLKEIDELKNK